ncbi:MAG: enoyl-CoA hydratase/isomerase family protein [Myxococcales bacterium]|nr:enoyl-CoA hydratase/isomerase family protein [Myxococcales bacterium]
MSAGVSLLRDGDVATLLVDRPHARNALAPATMIAFDATVVALEADVRSGLGPRVLLVAGGHGHFIAGGDLNALADRKTADDGRQVSAVMQDALATLAGLPIPVIAAVDGGAVGGGVEVLLACDLVVAAADARFALRQIQMGVPTGWGGARRLAARVGRGRALHLLWTGRWLSASDAQAIGLVDVIAPAGVGARPAALELARELAGHPAAVLATHKRLIDDPTADETALFATAWAADPHLQAVQAWHTARATARSAKENQP